MSEEGWRQSNLQGFGWEYRDNSPQGTILDPNSWSGLSLDVFRRIQRLSATQCNDAPPLADGTEPELTPMVTQYQL